VALVAFLSNQWKTFDNGREHCWLVQDESISSSKEFDDLPVAQVVLRELKKHVNNIAALQCCCICQAIVQLQVCTIFLDKVNQLLNFLGWVAVVVSRIFREKALREIVRDKKASEVNRVEFEDIDGLEGNQNGETHKFD